MRVLLIQAPLLRSERPVYPIGLSYISGAIKDEHDVKVLDANFESKQSIQTTLAEFKPDVIGIGIRNIDTSQSFDQHFYFDDLPPYIKWLKEAANDIPMIAGGSGFSLFPVPIMQHCPEIDLGVYLEGEDTFRKLLRDLDRPHQVEGVYYRKNGDIEFSGLAALPDFNASVAPPRMLDPGLYQDETFQVGVQSKRGCNHRCIYCNYPFLNGHKLRLREPSEVVDEIEMLTRQFGIKRLFFADGVFNEPKKHARQICEEMIERNLGLRWSAYFSLRGFDEEFKDIATESGCELFDFAPDALSQNALDALDKGIRSGQIKRVVNMFKSSPEPRIGIGLMFNVPDIKLIDLWLLFKAVVFWPMLYRGIEYIGLTNIRIYPNTPLQEYALEKGIISKEDDLFRPVIYDPWPYRSISLILRQVRRLKRTLNRLFGREYSRGD